jgi:hypothetical protein
MLPFLSLIFRAKYKLISNTPFITVVTVMICLVISLKISPCAIFFTTSRLVTDELVDHDELVGAESKDVTMEDASRMLDREDADWPSLAITASNSTSPVPASLGSRPFGSTHLWPRDDSFCSSSGPDRNDEYYTHAVLPLYHSLSKARVAVSPPACWGEAGPLGVLAFGRTSDDPRHLHAEHHHIFDTLQNISTTSFDPKQMHCNNCIYRHHVLTRGGDSGSEGVEQKCFILSYQCFPLVVPACERGGLFAIIQIKNRHSFVLAGVFLDLVRAFNIPMGTVFVLSAAGNLGGSGWLPMPWTLSRPLAGYREPTAGL